MSLYPYRTTPYKHQAQALQTALKLRTCALLMEPRTGKTKVAIDYLSALSLAGRLDRAVIIAPARVLDVWVAEFYAHCPVNYHLTVWDAKARKNPPPKVQASHDLSVVLVNYEAFSTSGAKLPSGAQSKKTGRYKHRSSVERWLEGQPAACVLDESHKIKSPSSKAATMIVSMRDYFDYRLILTGTPITKAKRVFDIHMQWKFLNPKRFAEWPTHDMFKHQFGEWYTPNDGTGRMELKKLTNTDLLTERIYADSFRVKRDDCFDLPPKTVVVQKIKLGPKAGAAYDELAEEMVAKIEHEDSSLLVEASIALVLTLRLSQITGGFATASAGGLQDERKVVPIGKEKLSALEELVDEAIENDEKMVICANFRPEMDAIFDLVERKNVPVYEVRGGLSRSAVTDGIASFKDDRGTAFMIIQPQAGGVGIDLSTAAQMVWFSLTSSWVNYTQACDRIALSKKATTYTYLLAADTVDEVMYDVLQADGDVSEAILTNPRKVLRNA